MAVVYLILADVSGDRGVNGTSIRWGHYITLVYLANSEKYVAFSYNDISLYIYMYMALFGVQS